MTCQTCLRARKRMVRLLCLADPTGYACEAAKKILDALERRK